MSSVERVRRGVLIVCTVSVTLLGLMSSPWAPVAQSQANPTSTPDEAGVIYAIVEPNDSLWSIATEAGISLQELLALNDLSESDIIQPGQLLIIGYGTPPPTATPDLPPSTPTATRPPPTPTNTPLPPPRTAICLRAFTDDDRDGVHDAGELFKAAVAFTIFDETVVVHNYITDGNSEPYCLEGLAPGDYRITRSVARDEVLTTAGSWALSLNPGDVLNLDFGSYSSFEVIATTVSPPALVTGETELDKPLPTPAAAQTNGVTHRSSRAGLIGLVIIWGLLLSGGLFFLIRLRQPQSRR